MRGRTSSAKSRLRSAGYKCTLCGRRVIDAATLERHQKTIHNVSPRETKGNFKAKPVQRSKLSNKDKEKIFDDLLRGETLSESKPKSRNNKNNHENRRDTVIENLSDGGKIIDDKDIEHVNNGESLLIEKEKKKNKRDNKDVTRRVEFECPVCAKTFSVYFTAHKHIQKMHSVNADGKKVPPNSMDLVQPIRVEQCYRCESKMRSNEPHICPKIVEESVSTATDFVCSGCHQIFVSLKTFDMHVAGLHSDAVDSMFFPTKIEFMNWRLEMERQTNAKYTLYGEYDSKKVYRCNYARKDNMTDKSIAYFCPSSMVVQDFSKGIQVHFYNKHFDHTANPYTLSSKYKKYSITSFLKNPNVDSAAAAGAYVMKLDDKDLHSHFKKLMDSIVLNSADVDVPVLKTLIERALEMSAVLTDAVFSDAPTLKPTKTMSDNEITDALQSNIVLHKRRRSVDSCETPSKAARRTRNKSLFNQSELRMSPKILNTFSLASNPNSDEFKSDNINTFDFDSTITNSGDHIVSIQNKIDPEPDIKSNKSTKTSKVTSFNESLSFNDSYKDFIDKNFIGKADKSKEAKSSKSTVKTKLGAFKQTSPRKVDSNEDIPYDSSNNNAIDEEVSASKANTINIETSKVNILNAETSVTISKVNSVRMDTPKVINSQNKNTTKMDTPKGNNSKINTRSVISHLVDPLEVNIAKVNRSDSSTSVESRRGNVSKVKTRSVSSPLVDPLELSITKVKNRNDSPSLLEPISRNISKAVSRRVSSTLVDPLKMSTAKDNPSKMDTSKLNTTKVDPLKLNTPKTNSHKACTGRVTPKMGRVKSPIAKTTPKSSHQVSFEGKSVRDRSVTKIVTPQKRIREPKYEVREQENDCNILVLKF